MDNMEIIEKKGYKVLKPKDGYVLYRDGMIYDGEIILGVNATPNSYIAIENENYATIIKEKEETDDLLILKKQRIALSKNNLEKYLESNPMKSKCHNNTEAEYSCTLLKQQQIMSSIMGYELDIKFGREPILEWNNTGGVCEEWTYTELCQLAVEMKEYVKPLVKKQQRIEVMIMEAKTEKEVLAIDLNF